MTSGNFNKLPTKKVVFTDKKKQNEASVFCSSRKSTLVSIWAIPQSGYNFIRPSTRIVLVLILIM